MRGLRAVCVGCGLTSDQTRSGSTSLTLSRFMTLRFPVLMLITVSTGPRTWVTEYWWSHLVSRGALSWATNTTWSPALICFFHIIWVSFTIFISKSTGSSPTSSSFLASSIPPGFPPSHSFSTTSGSPSSCSSSISMGSPRHHLHPLNHPVLLLLLLLLHPYQLGILDMRAAV